MVHGEYAADQVIVTLSAGDISADGRTATKTVDNLKPYTREDVGSTLYAGYPAEAVNNLRHCFFYTQFNDTNRPLMAACNTADDKFNFLDLNAAITFTAEGDYDSFTFFGNKKETIGYGVYQVKITPEEQNYTQYLNDPVLTIDAPFTSGENRIYVPAGLRFEAGYTIKFKKGEGYVSILKTHDEETVAHGTVMDMGDINGAIEEYTDPFSADVKDLDTEGTANCYIITAPGSYKFKAVYGNEPNSYIMDVEEAVVLWETWNDDQEVEAGSVIVSADYAEDYMIIKTPDTLRPGNAVVAALDAEGTILWSWHLWVPQTPVATSDFGGIMGKPLMDRNLGALVATEAGAAPVDPLSYGMVYQWGRKDPFTNTLYDPCPVGYRVPPRDTGLPFWSADLSSQTGWAIDGTNGWLMIGDPVSVFPIAGYRDDYSVGGMAKVGARTLYWTSRGNGAKAYGADLRFDKGTYLGNGSAPKARLGSVRCVVE